MYLMMVHEEYFFLFYQVADMYRNQSQIQNQNKDKEPVKDEEDFYWNVPGI